MDNNSVFPFDAVIILSQSDWYSEMRSNRYNYAVRFAQQAPVYFVQRYDRFKTELIAGVEGNITLINPVHDYSIETLEEIFRELRNRNIQKVLFWMYCPFYTHLLSEITIPYVAVYHATEALLGSNFFHTESRDIAEYVEKLRKTINFSSFVVAVSEGVANGISSDTSLISPVYCVTNGCDYRFWSDGADSAARENAVLYQGGIHRKLDFELLNFIINDNPSIEFWFCGEVYIDNKNDVDLWEKMKGYANVRFFGNLHPDEVRALSHKAKIGIIPFKHDDWLIAKAFPLKAFEYLAAGMEVISTPVDSLYQFGNNFTIVNDHYSFSSAIKNKITEKINVDPQRVEICKAQDYDEKFLKVLEILRSTEIRENSKKEYKKRALILYDIHSCHVNTIREHVNAFGLFSKNLVTYYGATRDAEINEVFLGSFEVVIIHYSVRVSVPGHLSDDIFQKLKKCRALKVLFIQDEYDNLASTYRYIREMNVNVVFTCVPPSYHEYVYPKSLFPHLKLVNNLTGYVSYALSNHTHIPISSRQTDVFYRGRKLPYIYGSLGMEKFEIGKRFKEKAESLESNLRTNLEANDTERIYGDAWYGTISRSKTMLGTESGSNVFDFNGDLASLIEKDVAQGSEYPAIYQKYIEPLEKEVHMNQISPKLFEAISLKTVLILYEGQYSGILIPGTHYLSLKKDLSNIQEIIDIIKDSVKLQVIADKAYTDIVSDPQLSYRHFIQHTVDKCIDKNVLILKPQAIITSGDLYRYDEKPEYFSIRVFRKFENAFVVPSITSDEYENVYHQKKQFSSTEFRITNTINRLFIELIQALPRKPLQLIFKQYKKIISLVRK